MNDLVRLIYASKATFDTTTSSSGIELEVGRILAQSRRNNAKDEIGGVLYYGNGYFFQCLEGERGAVIETYDRISQDKRHHQASVLSMNSIKKRLFSEWAMKYLPAEKNVRDFLAQHGQSTFNPFEFKGEMLEQLVYFFQQTHQTGALAEAPGSKKPAAAKRSFWAKLFGFGR